MRGKRKIEWRCSKSLERKFVAKEEKFSIESSRRAGVESSRTKSLKASARSRRGKIKKFFDRRRARDNITRRVALTNERVCTLENCRNTTSLQERFHSMEYETLNGNANFAYIRFVRTLF